MGTGNSRFLFFKGLMFGGKSFERDFYQTSIIFHQPMNLIFFGSIILKQIIPSTGDCRLIIDGQQRLTTFSLFFKALSLKINNENKERIQKDFGRQFIQSNGDPLIVPSDNDREDFFRCMKHENDETIKKEGNSRIIECFNYFLKNIDIQKVDYIKITKNISLIDVCLDQNDHEQQIFDTFNSLGVKLTTAELLKNFFFDSKNKDIYQNSWKKTFDDDADYWDRQYTLGNSSEKTLSDLFFFSFLQIIINSKNEFNILISDKEKYRRYENLFDSYKHFIKNYYNNNKGKILDLIDSYAKKFKSVIDPEAASEKISNMFDLNRINNVIFCLKQSTLIPFVLNIEYTNPNIEDRNKVYELLENIIIKRMVCKETAKNYNNFFSETLIGGGCTYSEVQDTIKNSERRTNVLIPIDEDIKTKIRTLQFSNKTSKGILFFIESLLRTAKDTTQMFPYDDYSLEHLMPKDWEQHWPLLGFSDNERNKLVFNIGNHLLLTHTLNKSYKNESWDIKKNELIKHAQGIHINNKDFINFHDQWDEHKILDRAEKLSDLICKLWKYQ